MLPYGRRATVAGTHICIDHAPERAGRSFLIGTLLQEQQEFELAGGMDVLERSSYRRSDHRLTHTCSGRRHMRAHLACVSGLRHNVRTYAVRDCGR
jgi:hypothetical protein